MKMYLRLLIVLLSATACHSQESLTPDYEGSYTGQYYEIINAQVSSPTSIITTVTRTANVNEYTLTDDAHHSATVVVNGSDFTGTSLWGTVTGSFARKSFTYTVTVPLSKVHEQIKVTGARQ